MKIINHPNMSISDILKVGAYYNANEKTFKKQKKAKSCYEFINQYIDNEINGKAKLQPLDGYYYKNMKYQQNVEFNEKANTKDISNFINWIKKFTLNKVKVVTDDDNNNNINLEIYYK